MINGLIEQLMARSDAQDAILQAIASQVTLLFEDWRDALDTMRVVAEVGVRESANGLPPEQADRLRKMSLDHLEAVFAPLHKVFLAREVDQGKP
jgi:hypothetical protein